MKASTSLLIALALGVFCTQSAVAEQRQVTKMLQKEPVSMLDWGIMRLEQDIANGVVADFRHPNMVLGKPKVIYLPNNDHQISINIPAFSSGSQSLSATALCEQVIDYFIRHKTLMHSFSTEKRAEALASYLSSMFSHVGQARSEEALEMGKQLLRTTELNVILVTDDQTTTDCSSTFSQGDI
ncbi:hypothetical protein [Neptunomonas marina]|uniref:Uncharacterized protein n=1 Tax=Neptunomonas marina TaxID=1815562 RepID=A0A437QDQ9_9GAMM|nr:hypothetical protein [Neptunomonas marina]RVU32687.1 hypothetical protein EOE65_03265 [Neptunomonas marina]